MCKTCENPPPFTPNRYPRKGETVSVVILRDVIANGVPTFVDGRTLLTGDTVQLERHTAEYLIRTGYARPTLRSVLQWASIP